MVGALTTSSFVQPITHFSEAPPDGPHSDQTLLANLLGEAPTLAGRLSLPRLLKACAKSSALSPGRQLHARAVKLHLSSDLFVQTSLVSMYSYCAHLDHALLVFDRMPHRNVVAWTAAVDACLRADRPDAALSVFRRMQDSGITPDSFSLVSVLSACAHLGALSSGRGAHALVEKVFGVAELTAFLGTALVDMYCKCGSVDDAIAVFDSVPRGGRTVRMWNAVLHGLAMHGHGAEAVQLFTEMESVGGCGGAPLRPNEVTFVALLCGCAHAGLVEEGKFYFDAMRRKYGIKPAVKHYGCMVDLLGRAGLLDDALEVIGNMTVPPNHMVWGALLSACRLHGDVGMAEQVMERILSDDNPVGDTSHYVIMSNIYRRAGLTEKMARVRAMVGKKPKSRSWIEIDGHVNEFGVGGDVPSHRMWGEIEVMLDEMDARLGGDTRAMDDSENPHSEKVALAFGLIRTGGHTPIRISKNLRICEDCHGMMKSVSEVYEREIVVRDRNRFHRFIGGLCSCKDYW